MEDSTSDDKYSWDRIFKKTDVDYSRLVERDLSDIIRKLKGYSVKKVLDLGCGYGHWSIIIAKEGFDVMAVDISSEAISRLDSYISEIELDIKTKVMPAQRLNRLDEKFDCIISNSVLDHLKYSDTEKVVSHIKKKLNKDGIAYVSFDGKDKSHDRYKSLEDGTRVYQEGRKKGMKWRYYSEEEIIDLFSDMKIIELNRTQSGKRGIWVVKS